MTRVDLDSKIIGHPHEGNWKTYSALRYDEEFKNSTTFIIKVMCNIFSPQYDTSQIDTTKMHLFLQKQSFCNANIYYKGAHLN